MVHKNVLLVGYGSLSFELTRQLVQVSNVTVIGRDNLAWANDMRVIKKYSIKSVEFVHTDINSLNSDHEIFQQIWDCVVYTAGYWEGRNFSQVSYDMNYNPFENFIAGLRNPPNLFLFVSSSAVYGKSISAENCMIESKTIDSSYGLAKFHSEQLLQRYGDVTGAAICIVRPFHMSSDREQYCKGRSHVLTDFITEKIRGHRVDIGDVFKLKYIPFSWYADCALAIVRLISRVNQDSIYNIGSRMAHNLWDINIAIDLMLDGKVLESEFLLDESGTRVSFFDQSYDLIGSYDTTLIQDQLQMIIKAKYSDKDAIG